MKTKIHDDQIGLPCPHAQTFTAGTSPYQYTVGTVKTPIGIVTVYAQNDRARANGNYTRLDFAFEGKLYIRTIYRHFTDRGLSIVGHRFAKEVTGNTP